MPLYVFECTACGHDFERLQRLSDSDPDVCPQCQEIGKIRRQLTAPQFRLAGGGWYETDFKKDGDKKRNLADKGEGKPAESTTAKADASKSDAGKSDATKAVAAKPATPAADSK